MERSLDESTQKTWSNVGVGGEGSLFVVAISLMFGLILEKMMCLFLWAIFCSGISAPLHVPFETSPLIAISKEVILNQ
jgi:hypothetical protein